MTETELALADVADALNRLALAVAALACILIVLSWTLDDMNLRVHLFGFMLRRVAPHQPDDRPADAPAPVAQKAAKEQRENHA